MTKHESFYVFRMDNLDRMFETGLYLNDLSMHDCSRDLVLAGTQQQAELKLALDQVRPLKPFLETEPFCFLYISLTYIEPSAVLLKLSSLRKHKNLRSLKTP